MADGFLGRWSRRKLDVEAGKPVPAEPLPPAAPPAPPAPVASVAQPTQVSAEPVAQPKPVPPTLEDVAQLTADSDFSRFASSEVAPEVKNAAMKKLFADPHFNVMDGLDVYIDDYGLPDPIPAAMLRSLVSAESLGLFREEAQDQAAALAPGENPCPPSDEPQSVAQSAPDALAAQDLRTDATHADPDLRLQQDPAPGHQSPGRGAG
jgi:hypothetical protein